MRLKGKGLRTVKKHFNTRDEMCNDQGHENTIVPYNMANRPINK